MKTPPAELRPRVPGIFDLFVQGSWLGTIEYIWDRWRYSYQGWSMSLEGYASSQEAVTALLAFHAARLASGEAVEGVPRRALAPASEIDP